MAELKALRRAISLIKDELDRSHRANQWQIHPTDHPNRVLLQQIVEPL
jgi:hypothetical protein